MQQHSGYLIPSYPNLYNKVIQTLLQPFKIRKIDKIVSIEAKGFCYGPTIAYKLDKPFIPVFKSGRVPTDFVLSQHYKDYSKKTKSLDLGKICIQQGDRVLIVDDVFETGASGKATIRLIEKLGGKVIGVSIIYNKMRKQDELFFKKYNLKYLLRC